MRRNSTLRATRVAVFGVLAALVGALSAPATVAAAPATKASAHVIVVFDTPPGRAADRAVAALGGKVRQRLGLINGLAVELPAAAVARLAVAPGVARVEPDHPLVAFDHGPDTRDLEYENAWGVEHIGSKPVHDAGIRGSGVKVAVIDTGIDYIHDDPDDDPYVVDPEFNSNYHAG